MEGGDGLGRMSNGAGKTLHTQGKKVTPIDAALSQPRKTDTAFYWGSEATRAGKMLKTGETIQNLPFASSVERMSLCGLLGWPQVCLLDYLYPLTNQRH